MKNEKNITDSKLLANELITNFFIDYDKTYDFKDIKKFAENVLLEKYTLGKLSGTLNTLISNKKIQRIEKSKYRILPKPTVDEDVNIDTFMKEVVNQKLRHVVNEIESDLSSITAISLSNDEFDTFLKIRDLLNTIKEKLEDIYAPEE